MVSDDFPSTQIRLTIGKLNVETTAVIDTGHGGGIIIPQTERNKLGASTGYVQVRLADDRLILSELFYAVAKLANREMIITAVCMGNAYVIGQEVLIHFRVCFDHGQSVEFEA